MESPQRCNNNKIIAFGEVYSHRQVNNFKIQQVSLTACLHRTCHHMCLQDRLLYFEIINLTMGVEQSFYYFFMKIAWASEFLHV